MVVNPLSRLPSKEYLACSSRKILLGKLLSLFLLLVSFFVGAGLRPAPTVMPISECHLPEPAINDLWPQLEFESETNIERVSLRSGVDDDLMLVLESESPKTPELKIEAGISIAHVYEENTVVIAGSDHILMRVLERDFKVTAASFFPANTKVAGKMAEYLVAKLPVTQSAALLDIDCGVGLFSAFLARFLQ